MHTLKRELSSLDEFVISFIGHLKKVEYVIISGYVAILFGRSRASEDVDIFIEKISFDEFLLLWRKITGEFDCIITSNPREAYYEYLQSGTAIRFAKKGTFIPNFELKFPKTSLDAWSLKNKVVVKLNQYEIFTSPLELQIPFKLFLGSEKDIEDARHLYKVLQGNLNLALLEKFCKELNVQRLYKRYIK